MQRSKVFWGVLVGLFITAAYAIPFTVLADVHAWYGSFLLWGITGLFIIVANFMITKDWGK